MKKMYLFAKEDVYDEKTHELVYLKDELVGLIDLLSDRLPRASYYLQDSLNGKASDLKIEEKLERYHYYDQVVYLKNFITLSIKVRNSQTLENIDHVHFGLFARENIYDDQHCLVYHQDDLIEDFSTCDKPHQVPLFHISKGAFYICQLDVIEGYYGNVTPYPIDVDFLNHSTYFELLVDNDPTIVEINKLDEQYCYVSGAWLALYDEKDVLVDEWISDKGHIIHGLVPGRRYLLKEKQAPEGYLGHEDSFFVVKNKREVQTINLINHSI